MSDSHMPLARFKVLDLTQARSGPTAVRQLADWGADVVKIELPAYDAAKLRCPALLIFGDYDGSANEAEAWDLFGKMTNSRGKRFVVIGDGTQYMEFEKRREELYREVENFLES